MNALALYRSCHDLLLPSSASTLFSFSTALTCRPCVRCQASEWTEMVPVVPLHARGLHCRSQRRSQQRGHAQHARGGPTTTPRPPPDEPWPPHNLKRAKDEASASACQERRHTAKRTLFMAATPVGAQACLLAVPLLSALTSAHRLCPWEQSTKNGRLRYSYGRRTVCMTCHQPSGSVLQDV